MSIAKRVAKNAGFTFFSSNALKLFSLVLVILIARFLGSEEYGRFAFALSFTGLFVILIDLGTSLVLMRETTQAKDNSNEYLSNVLTVKIFSSIVTLIVINTLSYLLGYPIETRVGVLIAAIGIVFESLTQSFLSVFQAYERLDLSAIIKVSKILLRFSLTIAVLLMGFGQWHILAIFSLAHLVGLLVAINIYNKKITPFRYSFDKDVAFGFLKRGMPFLLSSAFVEAYFRIDITLMSKLAPETLSGLYQAASTDTIIGWYSAAYNILDSLISIPGAISAAVLPVLVVYFIEKKDKLEHAYQNLVRYLTFISIPAAFGVTILADKIILLIYGTEYQNSILALRILVWTVIPLFANYMMGALLIATHQEMKGVVILLMNAIVNISLNAYLIPRYSYIGAAWATLLTEIFYFTCYYVLLRRQGFYFSIPSAVAKPILASIIMMFVITQFLEFHVLILAGLGVVVYGLSMLTLRAIREEDLDFMRKVLKKG